MPNKKVKTIRILSVLIYYVIHNSPAVKKCAAHKKAIVKKDVKSKVAAIW